MSASRLKLDIQHFLAEYWQQKPLLIPAALSNFEVPITADELAGLALEDEVESRIIEYCDDRWHLHHGPFTGEDFQRASPWTLLVQAVDHYIPEVARLRQLIDFIPQWRHDDVMVSYAVAGGSVGPHYDNYDVFLLQGEGQRRWQLGQQCDATTATIPHDSLRILEHFDAQQEFLLNPGDILYVPPGVAHWGVAETDCTTFSIGLRAPRVNDMLSRWTDATLEHLDTELFYTDPKLAGKTLRPGEISHDEHARVRLLLEHMIDNLDSGSWFGELVTEPRYPLEGTSEDSETGLLQSFAERQITLLSGAKVAWQEDGGFITVFSNGDSQKFPPETLDVVLGLCQNYQLSGNVLSEAVTNPACIALFDYLQKTGAIDVERKAE